MIIAQSEFESKEFRTRNIKEDVTMIKTTFKGHKIHCKKNITKAKMDQEIQDAVAALNDEGEKYAFFIWFSLSHGGICEAQVKGKEPEVEVDYMVDIKGDKIFFYKDIVKKFSNSACQGLKSKKNCKNNLLTFFCPITNLFFLFTFSLFSIQTNPCLLYTSPSPRDS